MILFAAGRSIEPPKRNSLRGSSDAVLTPRQQGRRTGGRTRTSDERQKKYSSEASLLA